MDINSKICTGCRHRTGVCVFADGRVADKQFVMGINVRDDGSADDGSAGDAVGISVYTFDSGDSLTLRFASIEYETGALSRLGCVVTQRGHSDWATMDIATVTSQWYRLHRRGPDFLIEYSPTGKSFHQMRIFHLPWLGETSIEMGRAFPPVAAAASVDFGVDACSPGASSFAARFSHMQLETCQWRPHAG